jgi:hypothetical protein
VEFTIILCNRVEVDHADFMESEAGPLVEGRSLTPVEARSARLMGGSKGYHSGRVITTDLKGWNCRREFTVVNSGKCRPSISMRESMSWIGSRWEP